MKKYYFLILGLYIGISSISAQQLPINNQYLINRYSLSPTYGGINNNTEVFVGYRKERVGFPGSTLLNMVNINAPLNEKMGVGANIISDRTHIFKHLYASLSYAYHLQLNENHNLSFGLFAGIYENRIDFSSTNIESIMNDPVVNERINQKGTGFNMGAGLLYRFKGLKFGFDVPGIYESKLNFDNEEDNIEYILRRSYISHISYLFNIKEDWQVEPIVLSRNTPNVPMNWEAAALLKYKGAYWLGINYRKSSEIGVSIGGKISNKICLAYTYEFSSKGITGKSSGTHEFGLGYYFGKRSSGPSQDDYQLKVDSRMDTINNRITKLESDIEDLKKVSDAKIQAKVKDLEKEIAILRAEIDKKANKFVETDTQAVDVVTTDDKNIKDPVRSTGKYYYVILESYRNKNNVPRGIKIWEERGYETLNLYQKEKEWYHLYSDKYNDRNPAVKRMKELRSKGLTKVWILAY